MNRLTIDLSDVPATELDQTSSIAIILPADVSALAAAGITTALNGNLQCGASGCVHKILIELPGFPHKVKEEEEEGS